MNKNNPNLSNKLPLTVQLAQKVTLKGSAKYDVRFGKSNLHNDPNYVYSDFGKPISKMI